MVSDLLSSSIQPHSVTEPRTLFVLVDASTASRNVVGAAIQIACVYPAQIVLVAQVATASAAALMDLDEIRALLMASDLGHGIGLAPLVLDEEERIVQRLRYVLRPLQREVEAAGVPSTLRLLQGEAQAGQMREILSSAPSNRVLFLSEPSQLCGSLHDLTIDLLAEPPCSLYLCGIQGSDPSLGLLLLRWLAKFRRHLFGR